MSPHGQSIRLLTSSRQDELSIAGLPDELAALGASEGPVTWIHSTWSAALVQALEDMGLDEVAVKSLREGPERPRVEEFSDHLYISLFSADHRPVPKAVEADSGESNTIDSAGHDVDGHEVMPVLRELRLFVGERWLISVGSISAHEYEVLVERVKRQVFARGRGPSFIVYHVCEWLVEGLQPALEDLDDRIDALEDVVVMSAGDESMQELFSLKRDLVEMRRRVAPLRDVMQRLGSRGVLFVEPGSEVYFRDVHDDVMRAIELLDTYRDVLSSALDLHLTSVSNRLNEVMKKLTIVATMFLPLSFIVGFFGTNFTRMPFGSLVWFVLMFVLMFVSLVTIFIYTRKRT